MPDERPVDLLRQRLRRLHTSAGLPKADSLREHAHRRGHRVGRSALAAVTGSSGGLRWATVEAFVDGCAGYAASRSRPIAAQELTMTAWRELYERAFPRQRGTTRDADRIRIGPVPRPAECHQPRVSARGIAARPGRWLLTGPGGAGKTQAAAHLAEELWRGREIDLLIWIPAVSQEQIISGYARAAATMGRPLAEVLADEDRRWLVVLDDVTDAVELDGLLPPPGGRTVITTRLPAAALQGREVPLDAFTRAEARDFLRTRLAAHPGLADDLDGVAADLGGLPLAVALAASLIVEEGLPCSGYRHRLAARGAGVHRDPDRAVAASLGLSVEAADRARPAGLATPLLALAAVLDPAGIPVPVLLARATREWLCLHAPITGPPDEGELRAALHCLHRLGLIVADDTTVTLHPLVRRLLVDDLSAAELAGAASAAADATLEVWPDPECDPGYAARLRAGTDALTAAGGDPVALHPVRARACHSRGTSGEPAAAASAASHLAADTARLLGPDHPRTLLARGNAARWRGESGDAAGAVTAYELLLGESARVFGAHHPNTWTCRSNLAYARGLAGDVAGAVAAFAGLLADCEALLGPDHPGTASARANLAHWRAVRT
ncbi:Kinesin light chain 2 [Catenuloplanes sp. NPDC051500]|uniref:Kinesin light chain 2 n=1 Tax=Catenuloplanes sp. NPDC051500 TaxID=3363959 RepID=UPI0037B27A73